MRAIVIVAGFMSTGVEAAAFAALVRVMVVAFPSMHGVWYPVLWDLAAVCEPGSIVVAQANFPAELARSRQYRPPFQDFFGTEPIRLDVKPDRLVSTPETLRLPGIELALIPGKSGETDDALYVRDVRHDILFVGDAIMPYSGRRDIARAQDVLR